MVKLLAIQLIDKFKMDGGISRRWSKALLVFGFVLTFILVSGGAFIFGPSIALHGVYIPAGLGLGLLFFAKISPENDSIQVLQSTIGSRQAVKIAAICLSLSLAITAAGFRWAIFPVIGTGLSCLAIPLLNNEFDKASWLAAILLLLIQPLSRSIANGFYFGTGDLIVDIRRARGLIDAAAVHGFNGVYVDFPGAFILIGAMTEVTNLPIHRSSEIIALASGLTLVLVTYFICCAVIGKSARWILILAVAVPSLSRLLSVYHPQQFGLLLVFTAILTGMIWGTQRHIILCLICFLGLSITHPFTILLMGLLIPIWLVRSLYTAGRLPIRNSMLAVAGLITAVHWVYFGESFVKRVLVTSSAHASAGTGLFLNFQIGNPNFVYWGSSPQGSYKNITDLLIQIGIFQQIAFTVFVAMFAIGFLSLIRFRFSSTGWAFTGSFGAMGMFPSPISYRILTRLSVVASPFILGVLSHGMEQVTKRDSPKSLLLVTVLLMGTTGPYVAADDISMQGQPRGYTHTETRQLKAVAEFAGDKTIESFWNEEETLQVLYRARTPPPTEPLKVSQTGVEGRGLLLVRERLNGRRTVAERGTAYATKALIGDGWINNAREQSHIVYDSGKFHVSNRTAGYPYGVE